ncbi:MAG: hypothetical protein NZ528_05635 [Caldilineales bacterium]|nr:hypothetical protein [Caldilineales bacterium]MDW8318475.1 hypothetical protein [Anaerolineae bacterium]
MASQVCPLLGLVDERGAYLTYPSFENRCYATSPHQAIALNEQTFFCLGGNYERCPRYQASVGGRSSWAPPTADEPEPEPAAAASAWSEEAAEPAASFAEAPAAGDSFWTPPPPSGSQGRRNGGGAGGRPVWPLLLAAGTLVVVLVLCALVSASWLGLQALSARLALAPTGTPLVERGTVAPGGPVAPGGAGQLPGVLPPGLPLTGTITADGFLIVVVTVTPTPTAVQPILPTATSPPPTPTPFPTDTPLPFFPTPTPEPPVFDTPTPRPTPTPRDTPTPFPTPTPYVPPPTPTEAPPTPTFAPPTATFEPFVLRFTAEPSAIIFGQESTLSWEVRGVRAFFLDGQPMNGPTGSMRVRPTSTTTYVLRVIRVDGGVQEVTQTVTVTPPTPTPTPTATPWPFYRLPPPAVTTTVINGAACTSVNGCPAFTLLIGNQGATTFRYRLEKFNNEPWPAGWYSVLCWGSTCFPWDRPVERTLAPGAIETVTLNFSVPALVDGQRGIVNVRGYCLECGPYPFFEERLTAVVSTQAPTPTPTPTLTLTPTPTATPTPTPTSARSVTLAISPSSDVTISAGQGCNLGDGCQVFLATITNTGVGSDTYVASLIPLSVPAGWDPNLCTTTACFAADVSDQRTLPAGASEVLIIRMRLTSTPLSGDFSDFRVQVALINAGPVVTRDLRVRWN